MWGGVGGRLLVWWKGKVLRIRWRNVSIEFGRNLLSSQPFRQHHTHPNHCWPNCTYWPSFVPFTCWMNERMAQKKDYWKFRICLWIDGKQITALCEVMESDVQFGSGSGRSFSFTTTYRTTTGWYPAAAAAAAGLGHQLWMTDQLSFTLPIGHYLDKKCQSVKPTNRRISFV